MTESWQNRDDRRRIGWMQRLRTLLQPAKPDTSGRSARLARFIAESRDVIYETDTQGNWTFLNAAWEALTGQSVADSIGAPSWRHVMREDWEASLPLREPFTRGARAHVRMELRYCHADGSVRVAEAMCQPFYNDDGGFAGTNGLLHDTTERRATEAALAASEARYRLLVEGAADALIDIDARAICRYVSPAFAKVAGLDAEQIIGHSFFRHTHPQDLDVQRALIARLGDGRCTHGVAQYRIIDSGAQARWIEAALHARIDAGGVVAGFFGAIRDVTEIVTVVAELELLQGGDPAAPRIVH